MFSPLVVVVAGISILTCLQLTLRSNLQLQLQVKVKSAAWAALSLITSSFPTSRATVRRMIEVIECLASIRRLIGVCFEDLIDTF